MTLTQNQFQILFVWIRLNKIRRVFLLLLFKLKLKTWNHVLFKQLRTVAEITKTITRKILRACAIRWIKWKIYSWLVYSWEQPWACWAKMNARWTEFSLPECFFLSSLYLFVVAVLFIYTKMPSPFRSIRQTTCMTTKNDITKMSLLNANCVAYG